MYFTGKSYSEPLRQVSVISPQLCIDGPWGGMHLSGGDFRVQEAAVTRSAPASSDNILHLSFTSHLQLVNGCLSSSQDGPGHRMSPPQAETKRGNMHVDARTPAHERSDKNVT